MEIFYVLTWKYWKSTPVVCSLPPPQKMISVFLSQGAHCEETFSHGFKGCFYAFVFLGMHFQHCMHLYTTHSIKQLTFASVCVCVCVHHIAHVSVAPHVEVSLPSGCLAARCARTGSVSVPSSTHHHTHLTWLPVVLLSSFWLFKRYFPKLFLALGVLSEILLGFEISSNTVGLKTYRYQWMV